MPPCLRRAEDQLIYGAVATSEKGMEQLMEQVKNVIGFPPTTALAGPAPLRKRCRFQLGGLDFDVPMDMDYDDPDQNLFIYPRVQVVFDGEQLSGRYSARHANVTSAAEVRPHRHETAPRPKTPPRRHLSGAFIARPHN